MLEIVSKKSKSKTQDESSFRKPNDPSWLEKYAPNTTKELKIHHTKLKAIKDWLEIVDYQKTSLLILYGNSGSGKSLAMELICKEMGIEVGQWSDDCWDVNRSIVSSSHSSFPSSSQGMSAQSKLLFDVDSLESKREQLKQFSMKAKYPSLSFSSNNNRNSYQKNFVSTPSFTSTPSISSQTQLRNHRKVLMVHDPLVILNQPSNDTNQQLLDFYSNLLTASMPIVLIVSGAYNKEDEINLTMNLLPISLRSQVSCEWIHWPFVTETKIIKHLEKIMSKERFYSHAISNEKIQEIALESLGDIRHATIQLEFIAKTTKRQSRKPMPTIPTKTKKQYSQVIDLLDDEDEDIYNSDDEIFDTDDEKPLKKQLPKKRKSTKQTYQQMEEPIYDISESVDNSDTLESKDNSTTNYLRDEIYSKYHAVAKILHAKLNDLGYCHEYNWEDMLLKSNMSADYLLSNIQFNALPFIETYLTAATVGMDITPSIEDTNQQILDSICVSYDLIGDADVWLMRKYDTGSHLDRSNVNETSAQLFFPEDCVSSLVSRSVLVCKGKSLEENIQRAKDIGYKLPFQALKHSKVSKLRQDRNGNKMKIQLTREQYYEMGRSMNDWTLDLIPFLRVINPSKITMFNNHNPHNNYKNNYRNQLLLEQQQVQQEIQEQKRILLEDDIVEEN